MTRFKVNQQIDRLHGDSIFYFNCEVLSPSTIGAKDPTPLLRVTVSQALVEHHHFK